MFLGGCGSRHQPELFGVYDQVSAIAALPVFVREMSLAGYLLVKGFRPSLLIGDGPADRRAVHAPA